MVIAQSIRQSVETALRRTATDEEIIREVVKRRCNLHGKELESCVQRVMSLPDQCVLTW